VRGAHAKFRLGEKVKMTALGILRGLNIGRHGRYADKPRPTTGVVVGFGVDATTVAVRRTGYRGRVAYHMSFWEPAA
jgi:hypothetical protein